MTESDETSRSDPPMKGPNGSSIPTQTASAASSSLPEDPSMTMALFVYWILPALFFATFCRYAVDTSIPTIETTPLTAMPKQKRPRPSQPTVSSPSAPTALPSAAEKWPSSYRQAVQEIQAKRPLWKNRPVFKSEAAPASKEKSSAPTSNSRTKTSSNPTRNAAVERINQLRDKVRKNPSDIFTEIDLADTMRLFDLQFREGGTYEAEAIQVYQSVVVKAVAKRKKLIDKGEPTNESKTPVASVNEEVALTYDSKSPDGLVCALHVALGKVYYMANMFEKAEQEYSECLQVAPTYLDALNSRGSTRIILGQLKEASQDFLEVILTDEQRMFNDAFSGLERILEANESVVDGGWQGVADVVNRLVPLFENEVGTTGSTNLYGANSLNRLHHFLFTYHDKKTKDYPTAWKHLTKAFEYKMSVLPPWQKGAEIAKNENTKRIFVPGFWVPGTGSPVKTPIFIVGFVRSGSTLLERVLDSHPLVVGTGENSVFNGRLDDIRNQLVAASQVGRDYEIPALTKKLAEDVVEEYRERWKALDASSGSISKRNPKRFVDKMLTNYNNVGFIHLLYPNALILHVHRNPMDSIFSAYKHEFPGGTLDYTSDFESLAEIYHTYREMIDHWDSVLPGRVTHVRYEDMVEDMPGMARAIIEAADLPWDEGVLDFHKKKHAVNTLSTTQVRKGVYKDSLKSWAKYEKQLQPMVEKLGERIEFKSLKTLRPLAVNEEL